MRLDTRKAPWRCALALALAACVASLPVISEAATRQKNRRDGSGTAERKSRPAAVEAPAADLDPASAETPEPGPATPASTDPRIEALAHDEATFQQDHTRRLQAVEARLSAVKRHGENLADRRTRWNELLRKEEELARKEAELRASFAQLLREMQETRLDLDPPPDSPEETDASAPAD